MIEQILPIKHLVVLLEFTAQVTSRFFHQALLTAFLRHLSHNYSDHAKYISIDTPESGRLSYQSGDFYRFSIYAFQGSDELLQHLIEKLQKLPLSVNKTDKELTFKDNLKLISLSDGFSSLPIQSVTQLSSYGLSQLDEECRLWQEVFKQTSELHLRWLSPVRFLKKELTANNKKLKGEVRYCHDQNDLDEHLLFSRLHNALSAFASSKNKHYQREICPELPRLEYTDNHCYWIDSRYYSDNGTANYIGGMLGLQSVQLQQALSKQWLKVLILGQYAGVGQRRSFGLGRYILELTPGETTCQRVFPAQSILSEILTQDNLDQAIAHNYRDEYDNEETNGGELTQIADKIQNASYQPPVLNGYLIDKKSGGQRLLMVPPFWDRVMQRSFAQVLSAKLETIMDPHSYGFRKGRSRITAKFDIQLAYREGYRWVYETDIKDFFNQLDINKLMIRLQGLFYHDPCLIWIEKWMRASLSFEKKIYQRTIGLPQGSPLSPVLANLFLDDFDNDMKAHGFRLIRFADDFVILCKSKEQAEQAALKVEHSLLEHGLTLNKEKTAITTMAQGFYYLGYLFVNDMVLEAKAPAKENTLVPAEIAERFHLSKPRAIKNLLNKPQQDSESAAVMNQTDITNDNGLFLCVQGKPKWLSLFQGRIRVMEKDERVCEQPLSYLQAIVLMGNHQISTQAIHCCMKSNVPIYYADNQGKFIGCSWTYQPQLYGADFWLRQQMVFSNPDNSLQAAKLIVKARLISQWEVLRQRQSEAIQKPIKQIKQSLTHINNACTLAELNGIEGNAGRVYFSALTELVPESFAFTHRNRRPPKDPVNVLLSLGYTLLYNYVDCFLRVNGFFPWLGLYHQPRSGYSPLAADLMEPHRYLVERCMLSAISLKKIKVDDFFQSQDGRCLLKNKARKKYLQDLIQRFDARAKGKGEQQAHNLIDHLTQQNQNIALWIRNEAELKIWSIR